MPMTPSEGMAPYATPDDFRKFYDARALGMLADDTNAAVDPGGLSGDAVIAMMLARASGDVESACMVGSRYEPADLQALAGNGRALLVGLVCDLAYGYLRQRRGLPDPHGEAYGIALKTLDELSEGKKIFPFAQSEQAGLAQNRDLIASEIDRHPYASRRLRRAFGRRLRDEGPGFAY
jgi:phage gp36-like protein